MNIAVATDDFTTVAGHVGRCNGFVLFEIEEGEIKSVKQIENVFTHHKQNENHEHNHEHSHSHDHHGHSHDSLGEALIGNEVLISKGMGKRLVDDLNARGIKTVITDEITCEDAAVKYNNGTLTILENAHCNH